MTTDWKLIQSEEVVINLSEDAEITSFLTHQKKSARATYSAHGTTKEDRELLEKLMEMVKEGRKAKDAQAAQEAEPQPEPKKS